ncbi:hypothetical protein ACEXQB_010325 [Herbiconiux sp. P18]|uniref:hypothetical protein n=1 Tax=Herbiconiux liangxiaofengii TaxID=3342795 RepID=UPI0035B8E442
MRRSGSVVVGTVALAATLVLVSGCTSNPTGALSRLAHLDQGTPVAAHIVPPVVPGVDADLVDTSVRLLAEHDGTAFWVGASTSDEVCFIAAPAPADLLQTDAPGNTDATATNGGATPDAAADSAPAGATASPTPSPSPSSAADAVAGVGFGPPTDAPTLPVPSLAITAPEAVCLPFESFGAHGAMLRLGIEGTRVWLHTEYMTVSSGWVPIAQNIAVRA